MLLQFLVVPFSCLLHLLCTQTQHLQYKLYLAMRGSLNLRITAQPSRHESKPLSGSPAVTLPCPGAPAVGLGQWGLQRQQHQHGKSNSHSPACLVGKTRQRTSQLLPLCVCAGVSVQAECLKGGRQSQMKPFSSDFSPLHLLSQVRRQ